MATLDTRFAQSNDIKYYLRDKFKLVITVTDQDGTSVDLSAKTMVFSIRPDESSTATVTISGGDITVSGASSNVVTVEKDISGESLIDKSYYYDLDNTTDNKTITDGQFICSYDGR